MSRTLYPGSEPDPRREQTLAAVGLPSLSMYRREDLVLLRNMIQRGTLPVETMLRLQETIAMMVDDPTVGERTRVGAFKAVGAMWLGLLKLLRDTHAIEAKAEAEAPTVQVNQQFNLNIPNNGRVPEVE